MKSVFVAAALVVGSASAASVYSTGFESPFAAGNISGQGGYQTSGAGSNLFRITSGAAAAHSGSQYVQYAVGTGAANTGSGWAWTTNTIDSTSLAGAPIVLASVWASVAASNGATRNSAAGLDLYDDAGVYRIAGMLLNSDGSVTFLNGVDDGAGNTGVLTSAAGALTTGVYHKIAIAADFSTHAIEWIIDGNVISNAALTSGGFNSFMAASTGFGDADLFMNKGSAGSGGGTLRWDDMEIQQLTPAPGTLALAMGGLAVFRRRR